MSEPSAEAPGASLTGEQIAILLLSVFVVAVCGLSYELMMGSLATTLLGSSIRWFSLTIGVFLSSMGIGSWLSRFIERDLLAWFVGIEIALGAIGGFAGLIVFAAYAWTPWIEVSLFGILGLIGTLVGLELPLLTRYLQPTGGLRTAISNVMALDYLGSLAASLAFPFLMLPLLGLLESFFAVGLLNLLTASVTLLAFRDRLSLPLPLGAAALIAVLLGVGVWEAETTMGQVERTLYADTVVHVEQTPYQRIVITRRAEDTRLYLDGHLQLSAMDEFRYHEPLVHPAMQLAANHRRVLLLGAGDGLAAREVLRFPGVEELVVVDLDPAITRLAREHPALTALNRHSLDDPRVRVINDDAFAWLTREAGFWDVILLDFPDPHDDGLAKLYSTAMYGLVDQHLAPGGVAVTQGSSPYFARAAFWTIVETVREAGLQPTPYHAYVPAFGEWGFVLMATRPLDFADVEPLAQARFLTEDQIPLLDRFPPDMAAVPAEPSTLDHPRVFHLYREGWATFF